MKSQKVEEPESRTAREYENKMRAREYESKMPDKRIGKPESKRVRG